MTENREIEKPSIPSIDQPAWQFAGRVLLWIHLALAGLWWWNMPGGFPLVHPRFWVNQVLPWLILMTATVGLYASRKQSWAIYQTVLISLSAMWVSALVAALVLFPISAARFVVFPLALVVVLLGLCRLSFRRRWPKGRSSIVVVALFLALGFFLPYSQRARPPETNPIGGILPTITNPDEISKVPALLRLGQRVVVSRFAGSVETRCSGVNLLVQPLLTFQSRSPDRCWTRFAPLPDNNSLRVPDATTVAESSCRIHYSNLGAWVLDVQTAKSPGVCQIEALSELHEPVYSHLNSFCELLFSGHERLSVAFSPCPENPIEFQPADYPTGRPIQAAYVDLDRNFHIVRASSGEKGPFEVLASGRLALDEPLSLTFLDDQKAICRIELSDWSSQASVALSPTAGWGFPENSIEFRLGGDSPDSPANVWLTLSGTSVGRGWDSVGHAAGVYRNRMKIVSLDENGTKEE